MSTTYNKTVITNDYAFLCGRLDCPLINEPSYIDLHFDHKIIQDLFEEIIKCYKPEMKIFFAYNITPGDNFKRPSQILYTTEPYHRNRPIVLEGFPKNIIENNKSTLLRNHIRKYLYENIYNLKTNLEKYFFPFKIEIEEQPLRSNTNYFYLLIKLFFS